LCAVASPAHAGEELLFGDRPEWVVDVSQPSTVEDRGDLPAFVRLLDSQTRFETGKSHHYSAVEIEILNSEGLGVGNLSLVWQPEFQEMTVHHVRIVRDGAVTDVLAEGQTFTILRREQNLEAAVLTGILTANLMPAGLEVGDVLQFAYTVTDANPVLADSSEIAMGPLNGVFGKAHVRISWPSPSNLQLSASKGLPALRRGSRNGQDFATLELSSSEPILAPSGAPSRYELVRMLEATSFASWAEVADLFVPVYEKASQIPADGPLREAVERIRAASDSPATRAEMALALVQNQVRYVALQMGVGGLVPTDAATTWSRRFGDCKAKTALLLGILRELGIEAEPVLVHSVLGDALPGRLPMVSAFDHVLLRTRVDGQVYFLDGTRRGDVSLARIATPHFVWGLPVVAGGAELVPMVAPPLAEPDEETIVRIDASQGIHAPSPAQVERVIRGDAALVLNSVMAQYVGQNRRQVLEQYWRNNYDFIEPESVDFKFDQNANEARISLTGPATIDWSYGSFEPRGMRVGYQADFTRAPGVDSDAPFAVEHPFFNRTEYQVTVPPGFTQKNVDGPDVTQTVAGVEYQRQFALADNVFSAVRWARSVAQEFPAADATSIKQSLDRMWGQRVFLRIPGGYRLTKADVEYLAKAESEDPRQLTNQGFALMEANEYQSAKPLFDKVLEIDPNHEIALANRAVVNAMIGNVAEAESDIARAFDIRRTNHVTFHALGELAMRRSDYEAAIAAFSSAIELYRENGFALRRRAFAYSSLKNHDAAISDVDAIISFYPDNPSGYVDKGMILARAERSGELSAHVDMMLERFPDSDFVIAMAVEMFTQARMDAEADALVTKSAGGENGNLSALVLRAERRPTSETDLALADLNEALKINPDYVPALLSRANTLWKEYRLQPALGDVNRAIELRPDLREAYSVKIRILMDMNRRSDALKTVEDMARAFPGDADMLAVAAQEYMSLGQLTKARELLARAREINPNSNFVKQTGDRIR